MGERRSKMLRAFRDSETAPVNLSSSCLALRPGPKLPRASGANYHSKNKVTLRSGALVVTDWKSLVAAMRIFMLPESVNPFKSV